MRQHDPSLTPEFASTECPYNAQPDENCFRCGKCVNSCLCPPFTENPRTSPSRCEPRGVSIFGGNLGDLEPIPNGDPYDRHIPLPDDFAFPDDEGK